MYIFYRTFASIAEIWPIILVICACYSPKYRDFFYIVLVTILLASVFNIFLKSLWGVPLDTSLGSKSLAFPSGHTLLNSIFFISLAFYIKKIWIFIFVGILLTGMASSTIYFKYHDLPEIIAGFALALDFSLLVGLIYHIYQYNKRIIIIYSVLAVILELFLMFYLHGSNTRAIYCSIGATIGVTISSLLFLYIPNEYDNKSHFLVNIMIFILVFVILKLYMKSLDPIYTLVSCMLIPALIFNRGILLSIKKSSSKRLLDHILY